MDNHYAPEGVANGKNHGSRMIQPPTRERMAPSTSKER